MKQTAVEWLIEQVNSDEYQKAFGQTYISVELIEKALEKEKDQIVVAFDYGRKIYNNSIIDSDQYLLQMFNIK
jgi:hypothetical protein